jgi:type II secretory pathway pseudopilin PulG
MTREEPMSTRREASLELGFSLIELGITMAVIVVLTTSVFVARGFLESARVSNAARQVNTIRRAAKIYADRYKNGLNYSEISSDKLLGGGADGIKILETLDSPWKERVEVDPIGAGDTFRITIKTPDKATCESLRDSLNAMKIDVSATNCGATMVIAITSGINEG